MKETFEQAAVRTALRKMFQADGWFNICLVESCLRSLKIVAPKAAMDVLHPLHGIHWKDMSEGLRKETMERTLALFTGPGLDLSVFDDPPAPPVPQLSATAETRKPGLLGRLMGSTQ